MPKARRTGDKARTSKWLDKVDETVQMIVTWRKWGNHSDQMQLKKWLRVEKTTEVIVRPPLTPKKNEKCVLQKLQKFDHELHDELRQKLLQTKVKTVWAFHTNSLI